MAINLPAGFELEEDQKINIPSGFEIDTSPISGTLNIEEEKLRPFGGKYSPLALGARMTEGIQKLYEKGGQKYTEILGGKGLRPRENIIPGIPNPIPMFREARINEFGLKLPPLGAATAGTIVSELPNIATAFFPGQIKGFESTAFQKIGATGTLSNLGISANTVSKFARGKNPIRAGVELANELESVGLGKGNIDTLFDKVLALRDRFGAAVGKAIDDIKGTGVDVTLKTETALEPISKEIETLSKSVHSPNRNVARVYSNVVEKLKKNSTVGLDDIRDELEDVGKALDNMTPTNPRYEPYHSLYGMLANVRDKIVKEISVVANNQQLGSSLLKANKDYSNLLRILPDVGKAASKEITRFDTYQGLVGTAIKTLRPIITPIIGDIGKAGISSKLPFTSILGKKILGKSAELNNNQTKSISNIPMNPNEPYKKEAKNKLDEIKAREFLAKAKEQARQQGIMDIEQIKDIARQMAKDENYVIGE